MTNVRRAALSAAILVAGLAGGCMHSEPPRFSMNAVKMRQAGITSEQQQQDIATALEALFGTPDDPFVLEQVSGLSLKKIQMAAGPVWSDQKGQQYGLYRNHCVHCHGITGDGLGPTAAILNPYPRDYRPGKYKFKSTELPEMPTHEDLVRIIRDGIPGTAMPSFSLLPAAEIDALAEYVKYLSIRGQVEIALISTTLDLGVGERLGISHALTDVQRREIAVGLLPESEQETIAALDEDDKPALDDVLGQLAQAARKQYEMLADQKIAERYASGLSEIQGLLADEAGKWTSAKEKVVQPVDKPNLDPAESIARGRAFFYGKADCRKCHGDSALGDGQTTDFDDWNKDITPEDVAMGALPRRNIIPRNLRAGVYRGGRRPVDLYRRIHAGINGVPMPKVADLLSDEEKSGMSPEEQAQLQGERVWNLVDYIRSLPYESINNPSRTTTLIGRGNL